MGLAALLSDVGDQSTQCILLSIAALAPCIIIWAGGVGLHWWPLVFWTFHVAFWAGYVVEFCLAPLTYALDALYSLGNRLCDRRRKPAPTRARGGSRSPSLRDSYAFTALSSAPTLNGSPHDVPGPPVQAATKNAGDIV